MLQLKNQYRVRLIWTNWLSNVLKVTGIQQCKRMKMIRVTCKKIKNSKCKNKMYFCKKKKPFFTKLSVMPELSKHSKNKKLKEATVPLRGRPVFPAIFCQASK